MTHHLLAKALHGFTFAVLASIGFLLVSPAEAAATKWYCDCTPEDQRLGLCKCTGYEFELKRSGTREFQARCTQRTTPSNRRIFPQFVEVRRDKGVTCSTGVTIPANHPYKSKQCTNWSAIKKNTVHMAIECYAR